MTLDSLKEYLNLMKTLGLNINTYLVNGNVQFKEVRNGTLTHSSQSEILASA